MDAEGDSPSARAARLDSIIAQLERILADLDEADLSRVALPVNDAVELAKAARFLIRPDSSTGR